MEREHLFPLFHYLIISILTSLYYYKEGFSLMKCIKLEHFRGQYEEKLNEPVVHYFLENAKNKELLEEYVINPSLDNKNHLDIAFQKHYRHVKLLSYISKLIYFYSIDFDKRINKNKDRYILIDHTFSGNSEDKQINIDNLICSKEDSTYLIYELKQPTIKDHISNEILYDGLRVLSNKQLKILNLLYIRGCSNKEIAAILQESQQTISYNHRTALSKLRAYFKKHKTVKEN